MTETVQTSMGARPTAQSSADTTATAARRLLSTLVTQGAETGSLLATRHATTATMLMGMDAVRTALLHSMDGHAHASHAVYRFALKFVETVDDLSQMIFGTINMQISVMMEIKDQVMDAVKSVS